MTNTKKLLLAAAISALAAMASACNTIEGIGEDLESAGDKAEEVTKN